MAAQENASRIPFTDELPPHITLAVVTRVLEVALRIAIQGIPEAPTGHEHHGFSIAVGDGDELMKMQDEGDGPEPVYFAPYDLNPFERGHLDIDENSVIRGAFNGDGLCVVDGRTAKCRAATMIVLSMRGGGKTGGGRHKSSRALSKQPGGGCWVLKCSEDDRGSKFKKFHVFFKGMEAKFLKAAVEAAVADPIAGLSSQMGNAGMGGAAAEGALRKQMDDKFKLRVKNKFFGSNSSKVKTCAQNVAGQLSTTVKDYHDTDNADAGGFDVTVTLSARVDKEDFKQKFMDTSSSCGLTYGCAGQDDVCFK